MNGLQVGALVRSFNELWQAESDAKGQVQLGGDSFSSVAARIWQVVGAVGFIVFFQTEPPWKWIGLVLLTLGLAWLSSAIDDYMHALQGKKMLEQIRWKVFDLSLQWRAIGLWDDQLNELKAMCRPDGHLNFDTPEYRSWWQRAIEAAKERQELDRPNG